MGSHQPIRKTVAPEIPDKLYFRIGDVARLCEVPAYVLRFWETEFPQLKPNKGGTGQRLYRRRDVETALRIKSLLYDQGYTIPGARQVFKSEAASRAEGTARTAPAADVAAPAPVPARPEPAEAPVSAFDIRRHHGLQVLRAELQALAAQLSQPLQRVQGASAETKPGRTRLILEPRTDATAGPARLRLEPRETHPNQRDLFAVEPPPDLG